MPNTSKPWLNQEVHREIQRMVDNAVRKEIAPIQLTINQVKTETTAQTEKIVGIDSRLKSLWGNGSGTPGFLDRARAEDKQRLDRIEAQGDRMEGQNKELRESVDSLRSRVATDDAVKNAVTNAITETTKKREKRTKLIIEILTVFALAGGINWITHLLHLTTN